MVAIFCRTCSFVLSNAFKQNIRVTLKNGGRLKIFSHKRHIGKTKLTNIISLETIQKIVVIFLLN